jgi:DNA-directed RNA polymerase II subunit RPB11
MPEVLFAGYKVPHPLHPYFLIKVQTDGTVTPQKIVEDACNKLITMISGLETKFTREFSLKDVDLGPAVGGTLGNIGDDPYGPGGGSTWGGKDYLDM